MATPRTNIEFLFQEIRARLEKIGHPILKHDWDIKEREPHFRQISFYPKSDIAKLPDLKQIHYEMVFWEGDWVIEIHPEGSLNFKRVVEPILLGLDLPEAYELHEWRFGAEPPEKYANQFHKIRNRRTRWVSDSTPLPELASELTEQLIQTYSDFQRTLGDRIKSSVTTNPIAPDSKEKDAKRLSFTILEIVVALEEAFLKEGHPLAQHKWFKDGGNEEFKQISFFRRDESNTILNGIHYELILRGGFAWVEIHPEFPVEIKKAAEAAFKRIDLPDQYVLQPWLYNAPAQYKGQFHKIAPRQGFRVNAKQPFEKVVRDLRNHFAKLWEAFNGPLESRILEELSKKDEGGASISADPKKQDHFYTLDSEVPNEKLASYTRVGIACYVVAAQVGNLVPLQRFFNKEHHDHLYCINPEKEKLEGWVKERQMGFVSPPHLNTGSFFAPLHRYFNDELHDHLYTLTHPVEVFERMGYRYEGVECLVLSEPTEKNSVPLVLYVRGKSFFEKHLLVSMHAPLDRELKPELTGETVSSGRNESEEEEAESKGVSEKGRKIVPRSQGTSPAMRDVNVPPALGVEGIAEDMAALLSNNITSEKGNMVGIFGEWGRGKSYLIREIKKQDSIKAKFLVIEYHAWKYQDTPASWAYLYEEFAKEYFEKESDSRFYKKCFELYQAFRLNISVYGYYPIVLTVLGTVVFSVGSYLLKGLEPLLEVLYWITLGGSATVLAIVFAAYSRYKKTASDLFGRYFKRSKFNELMGAQAEIQKELSNLLEHWFPLPSTQKENEVPDYRRVLLVIEDIDRCSEDKIIEIVDSLRIMMDDPVISKRVVVLAAIDERILKRAINAKYHSTLKQDPCLLAEGQDKRESTLKALSEGIVHEYMDKLFISGVKLGSLVEENRLNYFEKLVESATVLEAPRTEEEDSTSKSGAYGEIVFREGEYGNRDDDAASDESENGESIESEETEYELRSEEVRILTQCVSNFHKATPRKIRIFYYRYLLGRTLMRRRGLSSIEDLETFADHLVQESTTSNSTTIELAPVDPETADHLRDDMINPVIRECLQMVVAY